MNINNSKVNKAYGLAVFISQTMEHTCYEEKNG